MGSLAQCVDSIVGPLWLQVYKLTRNDFFENLVSDEEMYGCSIDIYATGFSPPPPSPPLELSSSVHNNTDLGLLFTNEKQKKRSTRDVLVS